MVTEPVARIRSSPRRLPVEFHIYFSNAHSVAHVHPDRRQDIPAFCHTDVDPSDTHDHRSR